MHRYISSVCLLMIALMLTFSFTGFAEPATPLNQTALTLVREDASLSSIGAFLDGLSGIHGVTFQSGDNNNGVKALQEALIASGYLDRGRDDGQYGKKTVAAVEKFQAAVGLPVTGKADLATQFTLAMSGDGLTVGEDGAYVAKVKHFAGSSVV